jgi:RNA polymerase sigma-70 factor (sigma-E family)
MMRAQLDFAAFYEAHWDNCMRVLLVNGCEPALAEDVVAEAFARAWASWRTVRRHPNPQAWVMRTALNLRVSWWRRRRHEVSFDGHDRTPGANLTDDPGSGVDAALIRVLRQLPTRQREVIALRVFFDLDTHSTARLLGIAAGTVKAHLSRAITALRDQLMTEQLKG